MVQMLPRESEQGLSEAGRKKSWASSGSIAPGVTAVQSAEWTLVSSWQEKSWPIAWKHCSWVTVQSGHWPRPGWQQIWSQLRSSEQPQETSSTNCLYNPQTWASSNTTSLAWSRQQEVTFLNGPRTARRNSPKTNMGMLMCVRSDLWSKTWFYACRNH